MKVSWEPIKMAARSEAYVFVPFEQWGRGFYSCSRITFVFTFLCIVLSPVCRAFPM